MNINGIFSQPPRVISQQWIAWAMWENVPGTAFRRPPGDTGGGENKNKERETEIG